VASRPGRSSVVAMCREFYVDAAGSLGSSLAQIETEAAPPFGGADRHPDRCFANVHPVFIPD
jgi:hypothetical protein